MRGIRWTATLIDPAAVGKPLLAFVHVDRAGWCKTQALMAIEEHPEVEEIHSVAGDTCVLLKVRTVDTQALEGVLARLYAAPGVIATRSYIVISTYLERPAQPGLTLAWPSHETLRNGDVANKEDMRPDKDLARHPPHLPRTMRSGKANPPFCLLP